MKTLKIKTDEFRFVDKNDNETKLIQEFIIELKNKD